VELYSTSETKKKRYKKLERARKGSLPADMLRDYPQESMLAIKLLHNDPAQRPKASQILQHPLFQSLLISRSSRTRSATIPTLVRGASTPVFRPPLRLTPAINGSPPLRPEMHELESIHEKEESGLCKTPVQRRGRALEILREAKSSPNWSFSGTNQDTPSRLQSASREDNMPFFVLPSTHFSEDGSITPGQSPSSSSRSSPSLPTPSNSSPLQVCNWELEKDKYDATITSQKLIIEQLSAQIKQQQIQIKEKNDQLKDKNDQLKEKDGQLKQKEIIITKLNKNLDALKNRSQF